jgi:HPt (histidine-containing phosphotransfer) domain-containing protein
VGGDRDLLREVLGLFVEDYPRLRDELDRGVREGNAVVVHRAAHTLKGNLRFFGETRAGSVAQRLEEIGKSGSLDGAGEVFALLRRETEAVLAQVKEFIERGR